MGDCKVIYDGIDRLKREMTELLNKPALTPVEWDAFFKASKAYKDLLTGCAMEEYGEDDWDEESSGRMMHYRMNGRSGMYDADYAGEYSGDYRGSRSGARRRNAKGQFMRGSSGHSREEMLDAYYDMLEEADNDEEREMIKRRIRMMKEGR